MRYRDRYTGHYVSKSTWVRSKAHGGSRYVRERSEYNAPPSRSTKGDTEKITAGMGRGREKKPSGMAEAPSPEKIKTIQQYYDFYDDYGQYEDMGEIETGIDY